MITPLNIPSLHKSALGRRAGAPLLAALAASLTIAGCGSSSSGSIEPGNENPNATAEAAKQEREEAKATSTSTSAQTSSTATTPTSGPLSKEPTVTPPSGPAPSKLQTKEIVKGSGPEAKAGDTVTVNYVGVLYKNGKEFDASWKRKEPFSFALGRGQVIAGWDKGVAGMRVGGRRELIIPAAEAYGSQATGSIPPNSPLVFVVDLLGV